MEALAAGADGSMIGQYGVGFYPAYLAADKVIVTTKHDFLGRGTKITLGLKDDQLEYLEERRLEDLVKKLSEFISYPISMWTEKIRSDDKDEEKKKKTIKEVSYEWAVMSKQKPHWMKEARSDHKGRVCRLLLESHQRLGGAFGSEQIKLYFCRVFIMENFENISSEYLIFVKGFVDSKELHLNIAREMLKQNKIKFLELFFEIAETKEDYNKFCESFSKNLKLGIHEDFIIKSKIADLLRNHSTKSGDGMTSLKDYVTRMKEAKAIVNSPFIERLKKRGYMVIAVNDYAVGRMKNYEGMKLVSATKEGLKLEESEDEKKKAYKLKEKFEGLCKVIKEVLGDRVEKVVIFERVLESLCFGYWRVWLGLLPWRELRRLKIWRNSSMHFVPGDCSRKGKGSESFPETERTTNS
ncbi:hypothetical protein MKW94_013569 [Papaver nudicaule]|uniref:Uncharacterized protein n=1 Tax=Papaver nudicaule TaxID=74823 RepID=A0AA41RYB9_PAPNU|nr:hypothetical protein [Papaver nudicaule]